MKTNNMIIADYESPTVEVILVEVEKGFATSPELDATMDDMGWG